MNNNIPMIMMYDTKMIMLYIIFDKFMLDGDVMIIETNKETS